MHDILTLFGDFVVFSMTLGSFIMPTLMAGRAASLSGEELGALLWFSLSCMVFLRLVSQRTRTQALHQLSLLFGIMEDRGQAPCTMVAGWPADVPKSAAPSSPIAVRPLSILSIVWRVYTSARAHALQEWEKDAFAKSQYAYIVGRDYQKALVNLQLLMDTANGDPQAELHVLSLDASKAFPSTPRAYMWRTLVSRGFPSKVAFVVEDAYTKGALRHRFNGSNVASSKFTMANGTHQGCATSVLGFNAILVEMCEEVHRLHPSLRIVIYADDISLISTDRILLTQALDIVEAHLSRLGVALNGAKRHNPNTGLPGWRSRFWLVVHQFLLSL